MARILFVQNFWFEYLGTMTLSALLKKNGHIVDLVIDAKTENIIKHARAFHPDIIGAYVVSGSHNWVVHLFPALKSSLQVTTILGGPHPTFYPEIITKPGIDVICMGEGEKAMIELASRVDQHKAITDIQNLWIKDASGIQRNSIGPLIEDLNDLPAPDRELYYKYPLLRDSPSKHFITGRGCPFNCSFCCNKAYKELYKGLGTMVRRPEAKKICDEIRDVRDHYPLRSVRFDDEVFLLKADWLLDFLDRYSREVNLPFSCLIRADLSTETLVKAMKKAGCYIAYFGIESGNDRIRNQVLGKQITREQIQETARLLRNHEIKIGTFNMVGMPGETFEDAWETVKINQEIKSDYPWCSIIQPYPKTDLEKMAKDTGCLDPCYSVDNLQQSYFNDTVIENPYSRSLVTLQKLFYLAVRYPSLSGLIRKAALSEKNNALTRWIFNLTYAYRYSKTYRMPFFALLKRAMLWKENY